MVTCLVYNQEGSACKPMLLDYKLSRWPCPLAWWGVYGSKALAIVFQRIYIPSDGFENINKAIVPYLYEVVRNNSISHKSLILNKVIRCWCFYLFFVKLTRLFSICNHNTVSEWMIFLKATQSINFRYRPNKPTSISFPTPQSTRTSPIYCHCNWTLCYYIIQSKCHWTWTSADHYWRCTARWDLCRCTSDQHSLYWRCTSLRKLLCRCTSDQHSLYWQCTSLRKLLCRCISDQHSLYWQSSSLRKLLCRCISDLHPLFWRTASTSDAHLSCCSTSGCSIGRHLWHSQPHWENFGQSWGCFRENWEETRQEESYRIRPSDPRIRPSDPSWSRATNHREDREGEIQYTYLLMSLL